VSFCYFVKSRFNKRPEPVVPDHVTDDMITVLLKVEPNQKNLRLDRFVSEKIRRLSRTKAARIIEAGAYALDGRRLKNNYRVRAGEYVCLYRPAPEEPHSPEHFKILFEDEALMAVNKPAGLAMHPSARYHAGTLTRLLRDKYGDTRPVPVHRIDRETSGIVLLAKTPEAERALKILFADRIIEKKYLAIVRGVPEPASGSIDVPLGPALNSAVRIKMGPRLDEEGAQAVTDYRTVKSGFIETGESRTEVSLVEAVPHTGRQHQIRAHLSHIGHSVVGDKIYGPDESLFIRYLDEGMTDDMLKDLLLPRHALHAFAISFVHPFTQKTTHIDCPLPDDLEGVIL